MATLPRTLPCLEPPRSTWHWHLVERVGAVEAGGDLARLDELGQTLVVAGPLGDEEDEALLQEGGRERTAQLSAHPGDDARILASDEDGGPSRFDGAPELPQRGVAGDVEHQVVVLDPSAKSSRV